MYNKDAEMKKEMCEQLTVLKKIRKKGKVNGYDIELAEAQAKDYMSMKRRLDQIETEVGSIKQTQIEHGTKLDLIIQRLNSPVEKERLDGQKWNILTSIAKHKSAWIIVIIFLISIAFAGEKIVGVLERIL